MDSTMVSSPRRPRMVSGDGADQNDVTLVVGSSSPSSKRTLPSSLTSLSLASSPSPDCTARPAKRPRVVQFDPHPPTVAPAVDMNRSLWHTSAAELEATRMAVRNTVFLVKSGVGAMLTEEDGICLRGLEHMLHDDDENQQRVRKSHGVVIAVQQYLKKPRDPKRRAHGPELMARIYRDYSLPSVQIAHQRGLEDAKEVEKER